MKRLLTVVVFTLLSIFVRAQDDSILYIERYSAMAVEEMYRSGVPASITLAQGLLESGRGKSTLATKANNHFGIKCHKWDGEKVFHDDDRPKECFRSYSNAEESFRDHSDFLRYHDRYKFLFDLEPTDYKAWATGLKAAGYATSPTYAQKLIEIIERYELYRFDNPETMDGDVSEPVEVANSELEAPAGARAKKPTEAKSPARTKVRPRIRSQVNSTRPKSPSEIEQMHPVEGMTFSLDRPVYEKNGVRCVTAVAGETYSSIAAEYNLFPKEILRFNDLAADADLLPGQLVYIAAKKTKTSRGLDKHICEGSDETLWAISQRYGVKLKSVLKMNGMTADQALVEDMVIILRK